MNSEFITALKRESMESLLNPFIKKALNVNPLLKGEGKREGENRTASRREDEKAASIAETGLRS